MSSSPGLLPGSRVRHETFGEGVLLERVGDGFLRVFFGAGEKHVSESSVIPVVSREERILSSVSGARDRNEKARLAFEAFALPYMDSAASLTAAKIDLLPHQVVLTHRIATTSPRRFMICDEVGLGKTIETALVLRELASRGELKRALMIVPAGLVNNWHRELNEVFHLNFEVFGSEGDVTDRKSNAFAKHDRLIASIDTLKRPERISRILEAPAWDLIVFDEAHHLTAFKSGNKLRKTENYKLAEALRAHTRDLLLLSATPHQGDHFRFWMLVQLLNPTLFSNPDEMVESRHRLNSVMFRRTKADACKPDGSPLFARRWVHTESFLMSEAERRFYEELKEYLEEGFALAKRQGNQGRALGFLMAIFQKIAASSFAAVKRTLRRRLIMLTVYEALLRDRELNVDEREKLLSDAKHLIHDEYAFGRDRVGVSEVDRVLADIKLRLTKKIDESELALASDSFASEYSSVFAEDVAASAVTLALPEERTRIRTLLERHPVQRETKVEKLLGALGTLWRQNRNEKVVVFATYLGTVDLIGREIEATYPGQGVVVLRGGDHGSKLAAEKKFRLKDGPKVLVCTAAGREGINLQFARILFNFDLPWNPMDIEQRIGRIHRYGQVHTAQVYNLVLSDTIEGRIFLLLDDKLKEIARTVGKVDESGNVSEDLRSQILGQLSERLSYDRLYQEALSDPELRRTQLELEAAVANASEARKVVFELFQDLEGFSIEDYKPFEDVTSGLDRLAIFVRKAAKLDGLTIVEHAGGEFELEDNQGKPLVRFTLDRETARERPELELLGLDHPLVEKLLEKWKALSSEEIGISVQSTQFPQGVVAAWQITVQGEKGESRSFIQPIAVNVDGNRVPQLERDHGSLWGEAPVKSHLNIEQRLALLRQFLEPMLRREMQQKGYACTGHGFSSQLIGWCEVMRPSVQVV